MLRRGPSERGALVVVSVPTLDGTGCLVERRIVCLALKDLDHAGIVELARSEALHDWLTRRLARRLARLQRNAATVSAIGAGFDHAIARHLVNAGWPLELQAGLFDRRDEADVRQGA